MFIIQQNEIKVASKNFLYTSLQTKMMITIHGSQVVKSPPGSHLQNCMLG